MTLVEVVVAVAVFGIVAAVLTGFFLIASARGLLGRDVTAAAWLAQQRVEMLRGKEYASLPGFAATEAIDSLGNATPDGPYTRVTAVTTPVLGTSRLTQIAVTVSWLDQTIPRTLTLTTLVADD